MTDLDSTLSAIDAATGCQQCEGPLGNSPSDSFCSDGCQGAWFASRSEPLAMEQHSPEPASVSSYARYWLNRWAEETSPPGGAVRSAALGCDRATRTSASSVVAETLEVEMTEPSRDAWTDSDHAGNVLASAGFVRRTGSGDPAPERPGAVPADLLWRPWSRMEGAMTDRWTALQDCEHPGEYLRMGDHPDMTGRFVPEDLDPDTLYCARCERAIDEDAGSQNG